MKKTILFVVLAVFTINTSHAQFGKLLKKTKKATTKKKRVNNTSSNTNSNTDEEKATYNAKAALSNSKINNNNSDLATTVDWNKDVYLNVQFENSLKDILFYKEKNGRAFTSIYFDNQEGRGSVIRFDIPVSQMENNYLNLDVAVSSSIASTVFEYPTTTIMSYFKGFDKNKYDVIIKFSKDYVEKAKAVFNLDMAGVDKEALSAKAKAASQAAQVVGLPKAFSSTNVTIPNLSLQKLKGLIKKRIGSQASSIVKVVTVGNPSWTVNKNNVGIPKNKYVSGTRTMVVYKGTDGNCYFLDALYIDRDYEGAGKYGSLKVHYNTSAGKDFDGEKIKDCSKAK
ncbi:MAG: hypothetical protein ACPGTO_00355 [Polaribacter sp.]